MRDPGIPFVDGIHGFVSEATDCRAICKLHKASNPEGTLDVS